MAKEEEFLYAVGKEIADGITVLSRRSPISDTINFALMRNKRVIASVTYMQALIDCRVISPSKVVDDLIADVKERRNG